MKIWYFDKDFIENVISKVCEKGNWKACEEELKEHTFFSDVTEDHVAIDEDVSIDRFNDEVYFAMKIILEYAEK